MTKVNKSSKVTTSPLTGKAGKGSSFPSLSQVARSDALWWLTVVALILIFGYKLVAKESEMLLRAQELNLWLPTGIFWDTMMQYPGGALKWLATYLTQFFFYPALGVGILCLLWLVISLIMIWAYRLKGAWAALPVLVPMALMACITQTGYWIYYQKLPGHLLVPTVGVLFAVICVAADRLNDKYLPEKLRDYVHLSWMAIVCVLGFPYFGAWALGATGLVCLSHITSPYKQSGLSTALVSTLTAIILIAAVPQILYNNVFEMTERQLIYLAALPSFQYSNENFPIYHIPYYAIIVAFLIVILVNLLQNLEVGKKMKWWMRPCILIILLCSAVAGVKELWYTDTNFQKELAMNRAIEELDWERVLTIARDGSSDIKPTRQMVMYKNLAIFRLGRAGDEMFFYPEGASQQNAPWKVRMTQIGAKLIYYHYGKENFCYRWCMEDGVEFGWKVEHLKFMARTSLLNKEWVVARKYLNLLKKTTFHKAWAERYEKYIDVPDAFDLKKLEASAKTGKPLLDEQGMREFAPIMHMMTYPNRLDGDNSLVEMYLIQTFGRGNGDDPLFQEMTLIGALYMKDIQLFWPRFMKYANMHVSEHMPRHYQEAAYLYGHLENNVDISHMPFDQEVRDSYERFMKFNEQCGPMTEEQKAIAFYPQFGNTFYYFYFLVRNQKTN